MHHPTGEDPGKARNAAACTQSRGAVFQQLRTRVWGPPLADIRALRRVAGATEHRAVAVVEGRTASGERHDVVDGQVAGRVGGALVARAPVAAFATPSAKHAGAEALPDQRPVRSLAPVGG